MHEFLEEQGEHLSHSSLIVLKAALSNVYRWANTKRDLGISDNPFLQVPTKGLGKGQQLASDYGQEHPSAGTGVEIQTNLMTTWGCSSGWPFSFLTMEDGTLQITCERFAPGQCPPQFPR